MAVAYRAKWLFDGRSADPLADRAAIVDSNNRIAEIVAGSRVPSGVETIDLGDCTLLPGLIDAHVHLIWDGWQPNPEGLRIKEGVPKSTLRAARHARDTLLSGVTTVRDCGCPNGISLALRSAIKHGIVDGPRLVV
ncbi:MAG TPA: amidohydrolase family protein, partial [Dehalococcoidia bacterium]|nr:amidohydrolase family protein [Dehalococcoidia bacterium]